MEFFLRLNIILPIFYNNNSTWLIFAPNINQSTFWIVLDGLKYMDLCCDNVGSETETYGWDLD